MMYAQSAPLPTPPPGKVSFPHTQGMPRKPLPEVLKSYPALDKLTWIYVRDNPGTIHVQDMAEYYGHHFQTMAASLRLLKQNGLVVATKEGEFTPGEGRVAGAYRVATAEELTHAKPYDATMKARGKNAAVMAGRGSSTREGAEVEGAVARAPRRRKGTGDG